MAKVIFLDVSIGVKLSLVKSICIFSAYPNMRFTYIPPISIITSGNDALSSSAVSLEISPFIRKDVPATPKTKTSSNINILNAIFFIRDRFSCIACVFLEKYFQARSIVMVLRENHNPFLRFRNICACKSGSAVCVFPGITAPGSVHPEKRRIALLSPSLRKSSGTSGLT